MRYALSKVIKLNDKKNILTAELCHAYINIVKTSEREHAKTRLNVIFLENEEKILKF